MNNVCLEISHLNKRLGQQLTINQLNLRLFRGKKVALLGLNGAGKSSFIRLLVGESLPDSGTINYQTSKQSVLPTQVAFKKMLGYQSDTMLALSDMTSGEYLNLCASLKGVSEKEFIDKIERLSSQWEIQNILDRSMSSLSKGNLQKLAIAQVFINNPKILFFDEPCQSLDPLEQDRFNQNIKSLDNFELCVFSTHNVNHALEVADEIILFHQSKIAYHFKGEVESHYILMSKEEPAKLTLFFERNDLLAMPVGEFVYSIKLDSKTTIEAVTKNLALEEIHTEFFLPEKEAVIPLFRLLASGELNLDINNNKNLVESLLDNPIVGEE